ncbi:hypothetical protein L1887_16396 [Cichorium endivia]|nr:hypothetical protein L1887_16396 [Cichorium endivia]
MLKDYSHLETCKIFHARRLVSVLKAYALYDLEIGYCQGEIESSFDYVELSYACVDDFDTQLILDEKSNRGLTFIPKSKNNPSVRNKTM